MYGQHGDLIRSVKVLFTSDRYLCVNGKFRECICKELGAIRGSYTFWIGSGKKVKMLKRPTTELDA